MNKKVMVITIGIVLAIVGGFLYVSANSEDSSQDTQETASSQTSTTQTDDEHSESHGTGGTYKDYATDSIATTAGTKILFFHAPWCPQCRDLETDIQAKGVPADVTIIKVDYDTNQALRQKYGVTLQTTFVKVDDSGELVDKFVAYDDPTLHAVSDALL